jgi:hypothetical protein
MKNAKTAKRRNKNTTKKSITVDAYVRNHGTQWNALAKQLRALVKKEIPDVKEYVNPWKLPTFASRGPLGYFMIGKSHVTFGLYRGTSLDDPECLLEGTGKNLRHVKIRSAEDLARPALRELIRAAAALNRKDPMLGMVQRRR